MRVRNGLVVIIWTAAVSVLRAQKPLNIVVFDNDETPESTLPRAVETAREAFRAAGVLTVWRVCRVSKDPNEHCILPEDPYISVIVVREWNGPTAGRDAMGIALRSAEKKGMVSYALSNPAKALAARTDQSLAVVLGCVMAHEVGHLMGLRHSEYGMMKPVFERRDLLDASMGNLHFTDEGAKAVRSFVSNSRSR